MDTRFTEKLYIFEKLNKNKRVVVIVVGIMNSL